MIAVQRPAAYQEHRNVEFKLILMWTVPAASNFSKGIRLHVGFCIVLLTHLVCCE